MAPYQLLEGLTSRIIDANSRLGRRGKKLHSRLVANMSVGESWYLLDRGRTAGPYTLAQIQEMRSQGVCNAFSKVSQDQRQWSGVDDLLTGMRAKDAQPAPTCPPPLGANGQATAAGRNRGQGGTSTIALVLKPFPVQPLLLLHFLTGGIFSFFWVTGRHGQLPKTRTDDPSASKAIGLCFVPFFNLYWFFIVFPRLGSRVNSLARQQGLRDFVPVPLAYAMCVLLVVPAALATAGSVVLLLLMFAPTSKSEAIMLFFGFPAILTSLNFVCVVPVFAASVQRGINAIFDAQMAELGVARTT